MQQNDGLKATVLGLDNHLKEQILFVNNGYKLWQREAFQNIQKYLVKINTKNIFN